MHLFWNIILNMASSLRLMEVLRSYFTCLVIWKLSNFFRSITTFPDGPVDIVVEKAAKRHGITPTQVIFLWVKAKGAVIVTSVKFFLLPILCWVQVSIPDVEFISTSSNKHHLEQYFRSGDLRKLIWFRWCYWSNSYSFSAFDRRGGGSNWCCWCKGSPIDVAFCERTFIQEEMVVFCLSCPPFPLSPDRLLG